MSNKGTYVVLRISKDKEFLLKLHDKDESEVFTAVLDNLKKHHRHDMVLTFMREQIKSNKISVYAFRDTRDGTWMKQKPDEG